MLCRILALRRLGVTFALQLDAAAVGTSSGQVSFTSGDADESPFDFTITGEVLAPSDQRAAALEAAFAEIRDSGGPALVDVLIPPGGYAAQLAAIRG